MKKILLRNSLVFISMLVFLFGPTTPVFAHPPLKSTTGHTNSSINYSIPHLFSVIEIAFIITFSIVLVCLFKEYQTQKATAHQHSMRHMRFSQQLKYSFFSTVILALCIVTVFIMKPSWMVTYAAANLTPPSNLHVVNDDHLGRVAWSTTDPSGIVGYKVTWGETGNLSKVIWTPYNETNIQPLVDGKTYQVEVQAVDKDGNLSNMVGPINAQTDPTFVNTLRSQMNGFFDDFNDTPVVDAANWYTSYNNATPLSSTFINGDQQHFHMLLENCVGENGEDCTGDTDRASVNMRALRPFDFTGRTGTIAFDFDWGRPLDGAQGRFEWYIVLSPDEQDVADFDTGPGTQWPLDRYELHMQMDTIDFNRFVNGQLVSTKTFSLPENLRTINVRKHSEMKVSQNSVSLSIDGQLIGTDTQANLDFTKAWVLNQQFQYNLQKVHYPIGLSHWDNFGFDAPATGYTPDVLHEYTDGNIVKSDRQFFDIFSHKTNTWTVIIPDVLTGETTERLFMDAKEADAPATVTVNGHNFTFPNLPIHNVEAFDTREIDLPLGTLHQGNNVVSVTYNGSDATGLGIQNVHVEIAFPYGSTAPYTPPANQERPMPVMPVYGPRPGFGANSPQNGQTVSGSITVEATGDGPYTLISTGHVNPVTELSVLVDGQPMAKKTLLGPAVSTDQLLQLDTTQLPNGQHVLAIQAKGTDLNPDGTVAVAATTDTIFEDTDNPSNNSRTITVNNNGNPVPTWTPTPLLPSSTPTPTSIVDITDTPPLTPTVAILPTLTPTRTPTPTSTLPQPTPTPTSIINQGPRLGYTTIGNITDIEEANNMEGSRFVTTGGGQVISMSVHVGAVGTNKSYQMAIYTDKNGQPGSLLATTPTGILSANSWNTLPITATLKPNTAYWLLYNNNGTSGDVNNMQYDNISSNYGVFKARTFGTWPTNFGTSSIGGWKFSIYATFSH